MKTHDNNSKIWPVPFSRHNSRVLFNLQLRTSTLWFLLPIILIRFLIHTKICDSLRLCKDFSSGAVAGTINAYFPLSYLRSFPKTKNNFYPNKHESICTYPQGPSKLLFLRSSICKLITLALQKASNSVIGLTKHVTRRELNRTKWKLTGE